jgi:hypothetical protein
MTRISKRNMIGAALVALMPLYAGSATAARVVVKPPPRVVVRLPAVRSQQQLSFWGVETNLQQTRDDWQPAPSPSRGLSRVRRHSKTSAF